MATDELTGRFPSPFSIPAPEGAEDWRMLYPYYALFSEERREEEEGKFWFFDGMHNPEPIYPFDTIMTENWSVSLNQCSRPASGRSRLPRVFDQRMLNGYLYMSPTAISDPDEIAKRAEVFQRRAGHYYENWDEIYANWIEKAEDCIDAPQGDRIPSAPRGGADEPLSPSIAASSRVSISLGAMRR